MPTFHSKQEYNKYESTTMSDHLKIMKHAPGTPKIKKNASSQSVAISKIIQCADEMRSDHTPEGSSTHCA